MGKLFGTDGVRGIANKELTAELALKIGESSAYVLGENNPNITVVIGRDTRISGEMLNASISAGLMSRGANVIDLGIVPTPAVSYLIKKYNADMGVMISASHNSAEHNGIKLFNSEGFKLDDNIENEIEKYILEQSTPRDNFTIGTLVKNNDAVNDYVNYLLTTIHNISTDLKLVIDCANGSASVTLPLIVDKLGLKATIINNDYNGLNINDNCGSTHLDNLIETVKIQSADLGIAFDGDADRCLLVDDEGNEIDGDFILAIASLYLKRKNKLTNNTLVGTVMSNLGLRKFCEENNINFVSTKVGDRYVLESMLANNYIIGGEQSGHIIFKEYANTGDGELTALQILQILSDLKIPLSEAASIMQKYPQVLLNVKVTKEGKIKYETDEEIISLVKDIESNLDGDGRLLIRASGTEDLIRVMIEGMDIDNITKYAYELVNLIKRKYGV